MKKFHFILYSLLLFALLTIGVNLWIGCQREQGVKMSDWLSGWSQRQAISISDFNASCPMRLDLSGMNWDAVQSDGNDIRVTDNDGTTLLDIWLEEFDYGNNTGKLWIKLPPSSSGDLYIYTGNSKVISVSDGDATFEFFDDFENLFNDGYYQNILDNVPSSIYGEPSVITDSEQIDLWFYGGAGKPIYYCHSTDGINYSTPVATNLPNDYRRPHILKVGSTYYLYVSDPSDENIYLYTGTDKIHFASQGIVLERTAETWDSLYISNTFVWVESGNNWYMLYAARGTGQATWAIGLATSSDGKNWNKSGSNPVLSVVVDGSGCGNPELARTGSTVIKHDGKYYMYYHSGPAAYAGGNVFRAYSINLTSWTDEGQVGGIIASPAEYSHGDHCLAEFQGKTFLWWSPSNQVDTCYINVVAENRTYAEILALPPIYDITDKWSVDTDYASISEGKLTFIGLAAPIDWKQLLSISGFDDPNVVCQKTKFQGRAEDKGSTIGLRHVSEAHWVQILYYHDLAQIRVWDGVEGGGVESNPDATEHIYEIQWLTTPQASFYKDGIEMTNSPLTTGTPTDTLSIEFRSKGGSGYGVECEWIFVRKYASPEPSGAFGEVESEAVKSLVQMVNI